MASNDEIVDMLREHISSSNSWRESVTTQLAQINTHTSYTKEALNKHDNDITDLKKAKNNFKGALWAFGIIWTALIAVVGFFKDLFH